MIIIAAVDDNYGLSFNKRRQSQDRILREKIISLTHNHVLWMNAYSRKQFKEVLSEEMISVDEEFLDRASEGEFCFVENVSVEPYKDKIEKMIVFKWNRRYPGDFYFDIDVNEKEWKIIESEEFAGSSHEKITMEVYVRE